MGFHFFPSKFKGGFIGVDIFFVISGYLITGLILNQLNHEKFNFLEFYSKRIRRIFPSLILVLSASFCFGWFFLLTEDYALLGKHLAGGAGFVSNFLLWNESGYFDNIAEKKPLLHLWSLGVEEQFYIIWPILLWIGWRLKVNLLVIMVVLSSASFYLNLKGVEANLTATFYSPQTRFWELMAGSILAWSATYTTQLKFKYKSFSEFKDVQKIIANLVSILGASLIILGLFNINRQTLFPGWWALYPVLGGVAVIAAGQRAIINKFFLSNNIAVWFGLISYPLYLWHWALLAFFRIFDGEMPSWNIRIAIIFASILLAWITYRFVEKPLRFGGSCKNKNLILVLLMTAVGCIGFYIYKHDGLANRSYPEKFLKYSASIVLPDKRSECFNIEYAYKTNGDWFCSLGSQQSVASYFAYGDSHAASLIPVLDKYGKAHNVKILMNGSAGCPPLLGIQAMEGDDIEKNNCLKKNERIFNYVVMNKIPNVILAGFWTYYTGNLTNPNHGSQITDPTGSVLPGKNIDEMVFKWSVGYTVKKYNDAGVNVFLLHDNPTQRFGSKDALRKALNAMGSIDEQKINRYSVLTIEHLKNQEFVASVLKEQPAYLLNFDNIFCINLYCPLMSDGKFLYFDNDHLSVDGSLLTYDELSKALNQKRGALAIQR